MTWDVGTHLRQIGEMAQAVGYAVAMVVGSPWTLHA
jgi:hypothetical protein